MELLETVRKSCKIYEARELQNIRLTTASISTLDITLNEAYSSICPSTTEYQHRKQLVHYINKMVKDSSIGGIYGSPYVEAFGSYIMDMFSTKSDLDLSMNFNSDLKSFLPRQKQVVILRNFVKILNTQGKEAFHHVQPILKARVPIVKFIDRISGIECDVSVENKDAITKSFAIHIISSIDERFKILSCLMKTWAKVHNINSSRDHTLNSLSIILLVAFHLQTRDPPILPPFSAILKGGTDPTVLQDVIGKFKDFGRGNIETLAELFISFLCKLSATQTLWDKGLCASTFDGSWIIKLWDHEVGVMSVEDFTDRSQNCSRAVKGNEFKTIYRCIHETIKKVSLFMSGQIDASVLKTFLFGPVTLNTSRKLFGSLKRKGLLKSLSDTESAPGGIYSISARTSEQIMGESSINLAPKAHSKKTLKRAEVRARKRELLAKQKAAGRQNEVIPPNKSGVTNKRKRSDQSQASNKSSNNISSRLIVHNSHTARRPVQQGDASVHARNYFTGVLAHNQNASSHFQPCAGIGFSQQLQYVPGRSINSSQYHSLPSPVPTSLNYNPTRQSSHVHSGHILEAQHRYRLRGFDQPAGSHQPQISHTPSFPSYIPRFQHQIPVLPYQQRYVEEFQGSRSIHHPFGHGYVRESIQPPQPADYYRPCLSDPMFHIPRDRWMQ